MTGFKRVNPPVSDIEAAAYIAIKENEKLKEQVNELKKDMYTIREVVYEVMGLIKLDPENMPKDGKNFFLKVMKGILPKLMGGGIKIHSFEAAIPVLLKYKKRA